jgi:hypothetical protein
MGQARVCCMLLDQDIFGAMLNGSPTSLLSYRANEIASPHVFEVSSFTYVYKNCLFPPVIKYLSSFNFYINFDHLFY